MPDLANWNTAIKACGTCQQWECLGCQDAANMFHVYVIVVVVVVVVFVVVVVVVVFVVMVHCSG